MSSPPNSGTSTKVGHLHNVDRKHQQRSLSFPAALNPFHKKAHPEIDKATSPVEPYEVAPGIWNTDATAKVFGYLDNEPKKDKIKAHPLARKPVPPKHPALPSQNRPGVSPVKSAPQNATPQHEKYQPAAAAAVTSLSQHEAKGQAVSIEHKNQQHSKIKAMRTVSRDDRLVQRGANPRTGLVSPFITSDTSDDNVARDYLSLGKPLLDRPSPKGRTRSGKWRQDRAGWSLVESPLLSPIAQSTTGPLSRKVSLKKLEDKLLLEMPGVDNPDPKNMTERQMRKYQKSIAQALENGESNAMVNPNTMPSPRPVTPEGPSTPPNRLHRIRRKAVGSGLGRGEDSVETVLVHEKFTAVSPTSALKRKDLEAHKVKFAAPKETAKESRPKNPPKTKSSTADEAFLGIPLKQRLDQVEENFHLQQSQSMEKDQVRNRLPTNLSTPMQKECEDPQAFPTLKQYLPRLQLLHPSHFANLETSSYRRPAELMPARLRPMEERKRIIEDACITTITSTSRRRPEWSQRPKVQRQGASIIVPQVRQSSIQVSEGPNKNYVHESSLRKRLSYTSILADDSGSREPKTHLLLPHQSVTTVKEAEIQIKARVPHPWMQEDDPNPSRGSRHGVATGTSTDPRHQQLGTTSKKSPGKWSGATPPVPGLSVRSTNTMQDTIRGKETDGVGTTLTRDHHGGDGKSGRMQSISSDHVAGNHCTRGHDPAKPTEIAFKGDGSVWFAGQWARSEGDQDKEKLRSISTSEGSLPSECMHTSSLSIECIGTLLASLQSAITWDTTKNCLSCMANHTVQTLRTDSRALTVLRRHDASIADYFRATKEVVLAFGCLLLFLNALLIARKVLVGMSTVMSWFWHPLSALLAILRWCVLM